MQMQKYPKHVANTWPRAYNQAENCTCCQQELHTAGTTTTAATTTLTTKMQAAFAIRFRTAFIATADPEPFIAPQQGLLSKIHRLLKGNRSTLGKRNNN